MNAYDIAQLESSVVKKREAFADYFCPIQHGVSTPSGSELLAHHNKLLLERNDDWVAIKRHENAFNSISRKELLQQCRSTFQDTDLDKIIGTPGIFVCSLTLALNFSLAKPNVFRISFFMDCVIVSV